MNLQALAFKTFFGGKPWYKSLTAWSCVIWAFCDNVIPVIVDVGLLPEAQELWLIDATEKLALLMGALGLRRAQTNGKELAAVGLVALVALGCGSSTVTTIDAAGNPVTVEHRIGGRGCIAIDVGSDGAVSGVLQQDATSDWAGIRALPIMLQTALTTLFGTRDADGADSFAGPSDIGGCDGIFDSEP